MDWKQREGLEPRGTETSPHETCCQLSGKADLEGEMGGLVGKKNPRSLGTNIKAGLAAPVPWACPSPMGGPSSQSHSLSVCPDLPQLVRP